MPKTLMMLFTVLAIFCTTSLTATANVTDAVHDVAPNKSWTITFNDVVDPSTVNAQTIYVVDSKQNNMNVSLQPSGETVRVDAPIAHYTAGETYTLVITNAVTSKHGIPLTTTIQKSFTIAGTFATATINDDGTVSPIRTYVTFEEANAARQRDEAVLQNGRIIRMPNGVVSTTASVTLLYADPQLQKDYAGVTTNTELLYVDSTDAYVQVEFAGQTYYVKHRDVQLLPNMALQSYYSVNSAGMLVHTLYNHATKKNSGTYTIGPAPIFLQTGERYYSTNGFAFYNEQAQLVGESYSYFQYVSPRVPSSYSAAELDALIMNQLAERQATNVAKYKDATTKSALIGIGRTLKEVEQTKRINALLLLSLAIHEGDYGMSCHALHYHNTFGLHVTDGNASCSSTHVNTSAAKYFKTIEDNIDAVATQLNNFYLSPDNMSGFRYNGLALGNKMIGMNVRYATDPYWGAKTAGHMYTLDAALGGRDYKAHTLAMTSQPYVRVRVAPSTAATQAYQYYIAGSIKRFDRMPLTLSKTASTTAGWTRLVSELSTDAADVYTVNDNVTIIHTH